MAIGVQTRSFPKKYQWIDEYPVLNMKNKEGLKEKVKPKGPKLFLIISFIFPSSWVTKKCPRDLLKSWWNEVEG